MSNEAERVQTDSFPLLYRQSDTWLAPVHDIAVPG